ncbi:hypothetical protein ES705_05099 [subsurface metagenome]
MNLQSERLVLKEISRNDMDKLHELNSISEIDEFNTLGIPATIEVTKEVYRPVIEDQKSEKRKLFCWLASKKSNDEVIGVAGMKLSLDKFKLGEIYYNLSPDNWGQGYATEIAKTLVKLGFEDLKLHKVEAGVATENVRSIGVLEKAGMTREGLRRKILPIRGVWKDNYHYAIVEDDSRDF